ncbi:MAG: ribosomal protein S18-alanine N-acetyltransferase [Candidatus Bathyarchaeota archaeon]
MADLPEIVEIEKSSFLDPFSKELLHTLVKYKSNAFTIATIENKIAGYASVIPEDGNRAHLVSIAVHPQYRRKKVAKKILTDLAEKLKKVKVNAIQLEVRESNVAAQNLYKPFGFKQINKINRYYDDGETAVVMELSL